MIPIAMALMFSSLSSVQSSLLFLVFIALFVDSVILAVWYLIGSLLNNSTVRASARNEFYQLAGTAILIFVVVFFIVLAGNLFYSSLSGTRLMNPTTISNTLVGLTENTQLSLLSGPPSLVLPGPSSQYPGLLALTYDAEYDTSQTARLDYPLVATSVVLANLTNQTATNLNEFYYLDAFIGFMSTLKPESMFCVSVGTPCYFPLPTSENLFWLEIDYVPYTGYSMAYSSMRVLGLILTLAFESFVAQLLSYTILLYLWPYLIFIGLILRATFFTRKIGGLLIAVAIASVLILPAVFSMEYLSLGNGVPAYAPSAYGFNPTTSLPARSGSGNYILNFFVEPSIGAIATHNGCYPIINGYPTILGSELADVAITFVPFASILLPAVGHFLSSPSNFYLPVGCGSSNLLHTLFDSLNLYGIIGITAYFMPLINMLIFLSAIQGLSGLMGGDTSLGGLRNLI